MKLFFKHVDNTTDPLAKEYLSRPFLKTITLHPFKDINKKYRFHNILNTHRILELKQKHRKLNLELENLKTKIEQKFSPNSTLERRTILEYKFFNSKNIYSPFAKSPRSVIGNVLNNILNNTLLYLIEEINHGVNELKNEIQFKELLNGYIRYHPLNGLEIILRNLFKVRIGRKGWIYEKFIQIVSTRRPFNPLLFSEDDSLFIRDPRKK